MRKTLKLITWTFMGLAVIFFWISLRNAENNLEYTIVAMVMIAIAWGTNYFLRKYEKAEKED